LLVEHENVFIAGLACVEFEVLRDNEGERFCIGRHEEDITIHGDIDT